VEALSDAGFFGPCICAFGSGEETSAVDAAFRRLHRVLASKVGRERIQPSHLGLIAGPWTDAKRNELAQACFVFAILEPLAWLRERATRGEDVDALVVHNANRFLRRAQRKNNPVGYAAFWNCSDAVETLRTANEVSAAPLRDGRAFNRTQVRFRLGELASQLEVTRVLPQITGWPQAFTTIAGRSEAQTRLDASIGVAEQVIRAVGGMADAFVFHHLLSAIQRDLDELFTEPEPDATRTEPDLASSYSARRHLERLHDHIDRDPRGYRKGKARLHAVVDVLPKLAEGARQAELAMEIGVSRQQFSDGMKAIRRILEKNPDDFGLPPLDRRGGA